MRTVDNSSVHGVAVSEATANAATHQARNRSTVHGVVVSESTANAILNTATASE